MQYFLSFLVVQSSSRGRDKAGCFNLIVFLASCGCWCSVALSHGAVVVYSDHTTFLIQLFQLSV